VIVILLYLTLGVLGALGFLVDAFALVACTVDDLEDIVDVNMWLSTRESLPFSGRVFDWVGIKCGFSVSRRVEKIIRPKSHDITSTF
jgi:hypothetical protein